MEKMTTIALKDGVLAFDSLVTFGNDRIGFLNKAVKTKDFMAAGAGNAEDVVAFLAWVKSGMFEGDKPVFGLDKQISLSAICINKRGSIFCFDDKLFPMKIKAKFYSLGSGSAFAMGAMQFGATAKEAVEVAKKLDTCTGGKIKTFSF